MWLSGTRLVLTPILESVLWFTEDARERFMDDSKVKFKSEAREGG